MTAVPKTAKKPADHRPKAVEVEEDAQHVVSVDGHEYTITNEALNDWELLDDLNEVQQNENPVRMPSILRRLLGPEQAKAALERLRDPDTGRVTVDAGSEFVGNLMEALNPN